MSSTRRYVILTPFDKADVVAAVLKLRNIHADVVATASGACVVRELPAVEFDDWDISELLGSTTEATGELPEPDRAPGESDPSDDADHVAGLLSKLSKYGVVLLTAEIGEDVGLEAGTSGLVQAVRVQNGKRTEDIPAGLVLNTVDPVIESLILGSKSIEEINAQVIREQDVTPSVLQRLFGRGDRRRRGQSEAPEVGETPEHGTSTEQGEGPERDNESEDSAEDPK